MYTQAGCRQSQTINVNTLILNTYSNVYVWLQLQYSRLKPALVCSIYIKCAVCNLSIILFDILSSLVDTFLNVVFEIYFEKTLGTFLYTAMTSVSALV
jgi:hypothetical protein